MVDSLVTIRQDGTVFVRPYVMFKSPRTGWYDSALHVVLPGTDGEQIQAVIEKEWAWVRRAITTLSDPASTVQACVDAIVITELDLTLAVFKVRHETK